MSINQNTTLLLNKKIGETPLECIQRFRLENPEYADIKLGYAGRLDPMAQGLLLVLVGNENKKVSSYLSLPKKYEFEFCFGISTDSYDLLGIIMQTDAYEIQMEKLIQKLSVLKTTTHQSVPPYSAARSQGKPLFSLARKGSIAPEELPQKNITLFDLSLSGERTISQSEFSHYVFDQLSHVKGNFRQIEIIESWQEYFARSNRETYTIYRADVHCTSGTYVRSLVKKLGELIGVPAVTVTITRTQIGDYTLKAE